MINALAAKVGHNDAAEVVFVSDIEQPVTSECMQVIGRCCVLEAEDPDLYFCMARGKKMRRGDVKICTWQPRENRCQIDHPPHEEPGGIVEDRLHRRSQQRSDAQPNAG